MGLSRKTSLCIDQNRMSNTASLSEFSIQLREFISRGFPPDSSKDDFNRLALALFAAQFEANDAYRKFCLARNVSPSNTRDWREIPALPTSAFRDFAVTSLPSDKRTTFFQSSGTTGERSSRHYHDADSLAVYEASLLPWFQIHFLYQAPKQLQFISLTPPPVLAPHSSLVHMFATVHRKFGAAGSEFVGAINEQGAWSVDVSKCGKILEDAAKSEHPIALLGTAFNFVQLLDDLALRGIGFRLPQGSRVLETGGYKGRTRELAKSELHGLISEKMGIPGSHIISEYGMCELSSQAYDSVVALAGSPRVFQFPPWARAQVVSPETGSEVGIGETGLIRIFDLANVWSVMAIQTADLGVRREHGFELLGRAASVEPRGCSLMSL